jgi:hypothetical protein
MSEINRLELDDVCKGGGTHDDKGADLFGETFVETGHDEAEDCLEEYS